MKNPIFPLLQPLLWVPLQMGMFVPSPTESAETGTGLQTARPLEMCHGKVLGDMWMQDGPWSPKVHLAQGLLIHTHT